MKSAMKPQTLLSLSAVLAATVLSAAEARPRPATTLPATANDSEPRPVSLFNGQDLSAWRKPVGEWMPVKAVLLGRTNEAVFAITPGRGVMVNGATGKTVDLLSTFEHGDVEAHLEFCVPKGSNSGVYFMGRYEIQIFDSAGKKVVTSSDCGGIYERWKDGKGFDGHAPKVNAARRAGDWQTLDVVFRAPRFDAQGKKTGNAKFIKVSLNGMTIHENVECTGPTRSAKFENEKDEKPKGPVQLQGDHGPVAFRNLQFRPVTLD